MNVSVNTALAGVALLLGGAAAVARGPAPPAAVGGEPTTALEVAAWLRARRPVEILDVRPADAAFNDFHLPRARHVPADQFRTSAIPTDRMVVVYAEGGDLAARASLVLAALGYDSVRVLSDGVGEWLAEIVNPVLPADAGDAAREAFAAQAELSRYFGGLPRIVPAGAVPDAGASADVIRRASRRGCAF